MSERKFDAVIFDWGGVISPGGTPDEVTTTMSEVLGVDVGTAIDLLRKFSGDLKRGRMDEAQFWLAVSQELGTEVDQAVKDIWTPVQYFKPDARVRDYIDELQNESIKVGVLSNTFPATANAIAAQGWYNGFDGLAISSDDGYAKPDEEFYQLILDRLDVDPERSIFVDDQDYCLEAARKFGIVTVKAVSPEQFIGEVRSLLSD